MSGTTSAEVSREALLDDAYTMLSERGTSIALQFYSALMREHPDMARIFAGSDWDVLARKIAAMLRVIVAHVRRSGDAAEVAVGLAVNHGSRGISESHYRAFIATLSAVLAERQAVMNVIDARQIWLEELGEVVEVMLTVGSPWTPDFETS